MEKLVFNLPPNAKGEKYSFEPDEDFAQRLIERLRLIMSSRQVYILSLGERFSLIKEEIELLLQKLHEIRPSKDGFIKWFLEKKAPMEFEIKGNVSLKTGRANVDVKFSFVTSDVLEEHLIEYCFLKKQGVLTKNQLIETLHGSNSSTNMPASKAQAAIAKINKQDQEQSRLVAAKHLDFLSGDNERGEKIMTDDDFKRMLDYTYRLIEHDSVPKNITPIQRIDESVERLKYAYYGIHRDLFTTKKVRDSFIEFLKQVFPVHFESWEIETIKKKFSTTPKKLQQKQR